MKLSSFIQETIYEIAVGIHAAKVRAKDLVAVSPGGLNGTSLTEKSYIDFDVTVVVKEGQHAKKGGKAGLSGRIQVASVLHVGIEANGDREQDSTSEAEQTHRITFKVPVYFNANHRNDQSMAVEEEIVGRHLTDGGDAE